MNYKQGDIVLVYFPESNLVTVKKRPAVILQSDDLKTGLDQMIVGMITSNLNRKGHRSRIFIDISDEIGKQTGLLNNSVIMVDNLATVRTGEIYQKIGIYQEKENLKASLKHIFGI